MKTTESPSLLAIKTHQHNTQQELLVNIRSLFDEIDELSLLPLYCVVPAIHDIRVMCEFLKLIVDWRYEEKKLDDEEADEFDAIFHDMMSDVMSLPAFQEWLKRDFLDWKPLVRGDFVYREMLSKYVIGQWGVSELMGRMSGPYDSLNDDSLDMARDTLDAWDSFVDFVMNGIEPEDVNMCPFVVNGFDIGDLLDHDVEASFPIDEHLIASVQGALSDPRKKAILEGIFSPFLKTSRSTPTPW